MRTVEQSGVNTVVTATAQVQHMCPFVHEVDNGTVTITWRTRGRTIELHSLRAHLSTFAETEISHEQLTETIGTEIRRLPGIDLVTVESAWNTAGMEVNCCISETRADPP